LIISFPGKIKAGSVDDRLISSIDFGPTVLSLAGIPVPAHMQGIPFLGDQSEHPGMLFLLPATGLMNRMI